MTLYELWRVADALISIVDEDGNPVRNYDGEDYGKKRTDIPRLSTASISGKKCLFHPAEIF